MAVAGALVVSGCADAGADGDGTTGCDAKGASSAPSFDLAAAKTLTVGSDIPFPPFEDGSNGDYRGFDIALVDAIGSKLGLEIKYEDVDYDTLLCSLAKGDFDVGASALAITPARRKLVAFSSPYYQAQQALLVREGSAITGPADLTGMKIGVQEGTTGEEYARKTDAAAVRSFPEVIDVTNALRAGKVDAVVIDQPVALDTIATDGAGLTLAAVLPGGDPYGLAVAKQNTQLMAAIDKALAKLKQDGTLTSLYRQYFGINPPASVLRGSS